MPLATTSQRPASNAGRSPVNSVGIWVTSTPSRSPIALTKSISKPIGSCASWVSKYSIGGNEGSTQLVSTPSSPNTFALGLASCAAPAAALILSTAATMAIDRTLLETTAPVLIFDTSAERALSTRYDNRRTFYSVG